MADPKYRQFIVIPEKTIKDEHYASVTSDIEEALKWAKADVKSNGGPACICLVVEYIANPQKDKQDE